MAEKKENACASVDIGFVGNLSFKVIPITEITIESAAAQKDGSKCKIIIKGSCKNIPDKRTATLQFTNHYEDSTEPAIKTLPVSLKTSGTTFEVMSTTGGACVIDPLECGFVGKGTADVQLDVDFPHAPTAKKEKVLEFNYPFTLDIKKTKGDTIGSEYKIVPKYDAIFNGCSIKYLLCETDEGEAEIPSKDKNSPDRDYAFSKVWEAGKTDERILHVGCGDDHKILYANEYEQGEFEFRQAIEISRGGIFFKKQLTDFKVPKPLLEECTLAVLAVPYAWKVSSNSQVYFPDNKRPEFTMVFRVGGRFSGFAPDINLSVDCMLIAEQNDVLFWKCIGNRQVFQLRANGSFEGIVADLLPADLPEDGDSKNVKYYIAIKCSDTCLSNPAVPVEQVFSSKKYLPLKAYSGNEVIDYPECWMLSSPTSGDGKVLPGRQDLITMDEIKGIIPLAPMEAILKIHKPLNETFREFDILTKIQIAHFMCHIPVETGNLASLTEKKAGTGDPFSVGRGIIQLTGKSNYTGFSNYLKRPDILANPGLVAEDSSLTCRSAGWWWMENKMNQAVDKEDFVAEVLKVNNGTNGLADRWEALKRGYKVLKIDKTDEQLQKLRASAKVKNYTLA